MRVTAGNYKLSGGVSKPQDSSIRKMKNGKNKRVALVYMRPSPRRGAIYMTRFIHESRLI